MKFPKQKKKPKPNSEGCNIQSNNTLLFHNRTTLKFLRHNIWFPLMSVMRKRTDIRQRMMVRGTNYQRNQMLGASLSVIELEMSSQFSVIEIPSL
ncbi:unnamed protein product, partial [Litomosoides sigmodontis]